MTAIRLPTFDAKLVEDLILLNNLDPSKLKSIAEVAVRLIVVTGEGRFCEHSFRLFKTL